METYNGWTNYETWRIALEYNLTDIEMFGGYNAEALKEYIKEDLKENCKNQMTISYAIAFVNEVNWNEIADKVEIYSNEEI